MLEGNQDDKDNKGNEEFHTFYTPNYITSDSIAVVATKIVSINIERHKHFERVVDFLKKENPEIICLMEVCESDVAILAGESYPFRVYAPNSVMPESEGVGTTGVAILSKEMMDDYEVFYCGEKTDAHLVNTEFGGHTPTVILATSGTLQIGTIHFTWTSNGSVDDKQRHHMEVLLDYLSTKDKLIVCGDFNIPRGNEMYLRLAEKYKDNIPLTIDTTLDPELHRANFEKSGKLKYVVDYVWSTPTYEVSEVRVEQGVSDHCGLVFSVTQN